MKYTHAVMARVPNTFGSEFPSVDLKLAKEQHRRLVAIMRELGIDVLELPPDECSPLSVYTHDLAVVHNGIALMCRPDSKGTRQAEIDEVKAVLQKELNQRIAEMASPKGLLNGSDVLFTGREFFIGISKSSNTEGALAIANTWPEYPCTPIKVDGDHNLKDFLSMAGPDILSVSTSPKSQSVLKRIEREAMYRYNTLTLPEDVAANCLYVNGTLIHRSPEEAPKSNEVLSSKIDFPRKTVSISEFCKVENDSLTSSSKRTISSLIILIRKSKYIKL